MKPLMERKPLTVKPEAEPVQKMYFVAVTPPEGSTWWGVRPAVSEDAARQEVMALTGKTRQEIAGRVSVAPLRPPKGKDYLSKEFTVTRKSKEEFLRGLLISVN